MKAKLRLGEISIIISALLWGTIGIFTRNLSDLGFKSVQIVAVRAFITVVVLGIIILLKDRSLFKIHLRDLWMFFGTGICSFLFFNICYMSSTIENSLSVACILMYTSPFWVTMLSAPLFKEKITSLKCICLLICFIGCIFMCLSGSLRCTKLGFIYGLLSGFGYALYSIFGKYAAKKYNALTITFYTFLFALIGSLPICHLETLIPLITTVRGSINCVAVSILCTILPYILYTYGLSKTEAGKASVLSIIEPCMTTVVGMIAFSEMPGISGFAGIMLVIAGLIALQRAKTIEKR